MRHGLACLGVVLLTSFSVSAAQQQEKKDSAAATAPAPTTGVAAAGDAAKAGASAERKNPVKPTPESMAAVKKIYGYDCAMCHGAAGDGKGDLAASMNLSLKNWGDTGALAGISDGDIFDIITKGKGKMPSNGDRLTAEKAWTLVHYVRSFAKGHGAKKDEAPKDEAPKDTPATPTATPPAS